MHSCLHHLVRDYKKTIKSGLQAGANQDQVSVEDLHLQIQALQETVASMHASIPMPQHRLTWREQSVHGGRPVPDPVQGGSQDSIPWQEPTPHFRRPMDPPTDTGSDGNPTMQIIGTQSLPLYTFVLNEVGTKLDKKEYIDLKLLMDKDEEPKKSK